ncbi:MAG TPA: pentapeptide repeat-containing protein [Polyangiaceae bacterium]|nr:pentapeptide repeat-containing protein [Polyangiaceae bacterium]
MALLFDNPLAELALALAGWAGCLPKQCAPAEEPARPTHVSRRRADLEQRLLQTKECQDCMLVEIELSGADLRGARLRGALLKGNLRGVDLRDADLEHAELSGDLQGADLRGAETKDLTIANAKLAKARLDGLDLRDLRWADTTDWSYAILRGANLDNVSFVGSSGSRHRREPGSFFDVPVGGTSLRGADLRDASLRNAGLSLCDLRDADLRGADLRDAGLPSWPPDRENANLAGALGPWDIRCADPSLGECVPRTAADRRKVLKLKTRVCMVGFSCKP